MKENLILKNKLKESKTGKGISQADLADEVGLPRATISSIEMGQFNPIAKLVQKLQFILKQYI